ncbi:bZIP transcription factor 27-like [Zingiber officinale]|uniref:bZIP transcription factor 27-like n=1 Tax=Zingiber officinale TaxID=94328 RepID=UPI001C4A81F3|nr:bZIP transcription factor 27-like [Zingiber officinale]
MASEASSSSSSLPSPTQRRVAAAEVWKDISLNSLNNRDTPSTPDPLFLRCFLISCSDARPASDSTDAGNVSAAVDPRKERMIKNRESAARSRARKQAYTNELEKEVDHLLKENRRLKIKYEELVKQALSAGLPVGKKRKIQRTTSAQF